MEIRNNIGVSLIYEAMIYLCKETKSTKVDTWLLHYSYTRSLINQQFELYSMHSYLYTQKVSTVANLQEGNKIYNAILLWKTLFPLNTGCLRVVRPCRYCSNVTASYSKTDRCLSTTLMILYYSSFLSSLSCEQLCSHFIANCPIKWLQ